MSAGDSLRARLRYVAPPTSGRLTESEFLLAGATAGVLGWGGTQLLSWVDPPRAAFLAVALWVVLVAGFSALTVLHGPDETRFSDAMFVWATVNSAATALSLAGLAGLVPGQVAFWHGWVAAAAVGYCWTGGLLAGAGQRGRGRGYLAAGLVALSVLLVGTVAFARVESVAFVLLALLHAIPLGLDARRQSWDAPTGTPVG
ncbi:hypothetical protein [Haloarcula marina]|uniref:hypothetical protein n=1 Tax=Haloarcula marina TaxID=2961574 RepID=UPI0020B8FA3D|nr:hypothetical protein [Halomicroarcula marina]